LNYWAWINYSQKNSLYISPLAEKYVVFFDWTKVQKKDRPYLICIIYSFFFLQYYCKPFDELLFQNTNWHDCDLYSGNVVKNVFIIISSLSLPNVFCHYMIESWENKPFFSGKLLLFSDWLCLAGIIIFDIYYGWMTPLSSLIYTIDRFR